MSEFRKQFDQSKAEYQSAKYPGDLAADLFRRQKPTGRMMIWRIGFSVAAAACVAVAIGVWEMNSSRIDSYSSTHNTSPFNLPPTTSPDTALATTDDGSLSPAVPSSQDMPDSATSFPTALPTMPEDTGSSFPSALSMPSFSTTSTDTSSS